MLTEPVQHRGASSPPRLKNRRRERTKDCLERKRTAPASAHNRLDVRPGHWSRYKASPRTNRFHALQQISADLWAGCTAHVLVATHRSEGPNALATNAHIRWHLAGHSRQGCVLIQSVGSGSSIDTAPALSGLCSACHTRGVSTGCRGTYHNRSLHEPLGFPRPVASSGVAPHQWTSSKSKITFGSAAWVQASVRKGNEGEASHHADKHKQNGGGRRQGACFQHHLWVQWRWRATGRQAGGWGGWWHMARPAM